MPLETATYINQLVAANPAHSDGLNNADAHMRLIKGVLQAQFPNFTAAALASTNANIDAAVSTVVTNGVSVLANAGAHFLTNTGDGIKNPSAGTVAVSTGGTSATTFTATAVATTGTISATAGLLTTPGMVPIGAIILWPSNTLPPSTEGTFQWCNGQAISRTTYATAYARLGTIWGAGDGSTTFNLPNFQDVALTGRDTMGGATSPGLLPSIGAAKSTLGGGVFGADTHTQTQAEMPAHFHSCAIYDPGHYHTVNYGQGAASYNFYNAGFQGGTIQSVNTTTATTGIYVNSSNGTNTTYTTGSGSAFNITQPSMAMNYIIRIL